MGNPFLIPTTNSHQSLWEQWGDSKGLYHTKLSVFRTNRETTGVEWEDLGCKSPPSASPSSPQNIFYTVVTSTAGGWVNNGRRTTNCTNLYINCNHHAWKWGKQGLVTNFCTFSHQDPPKLVCAHACETARVCECEGTCQMWNHYTVIRRYGAELYYRRAGHYGRNTLEMGKMAGRWSHFIKSGKF